MSTATPGPQSLTLALKRWRNGDHAAADLLAEQIEAELRRIARALLRRERSDHTLQATALINEAYIRLVDQAHVDWRSRSHFYAIAARTMRRVLLDHARKRLAKKRGAGDQRVSLSHDIGTGEVLKYEQLLDIDDALERLAQCNARLARVVELKVFASLTNPEIAEVIGVSVPTVARDWRAAREWLCRALREGAAPGESAARAGVPR